MGHVRQRGFSGEAQDRRARATIQRTERSHLEGSAFSSHLEILCRSAQCFLTSKQAECWPVAVRVSNRFADHLSLHGGL